MRETESLCAENIGLKDIAPSHSGGSISRREQAMTLMLFFKKIHLR